jgi:gliding motility-associated-like protein
MQLSRVFHPVLLGYILLLLSVNQLAAQGCNFPLPPSNTCANAPLLCNLDGYCSDNSAAANSGTPNAFCGVVENNNWISFIAGSETLEIKVSVFDCNNGNGLQVQVFETSNCNTFIAKSNCLDPVVNNGTGTMTATDLEIGQIYYLMMDGKGGDVCQYSYELLQGVTLSPASAIITPPGYLCDGELITLDATTWSSNAGLTPEWSTMDGNIISGENTTSIVADAPGTYNLLVEDEGGCTDSTFVLVEWAPLPVPAIDPADTLNCTNNTMVDLNGDNSTSLNDVFYTWSTITGNIISGEDSAMPTVSQPGFYYLQVTDQVTLCSAMDTVSVPIDANTPFALAGGGGELNCITPDVELSGAGSSFGPDFIYQWISPNGNFISGEQTLFPLVDEPGVYQLSVTNVINGCIAEDAIEVTLNEERPTGAVISTFAPCFEKINGRIIVNTVYGGTPNYLYSFGDNIQTYKNNADNLTPGEYNVTIIDDTGCEWDTLVTVGNEVQLLADLGEDFYLPLGCDYVLAPLINIDVSEVQDFAWTPAELFSCDSCFNQTILPLEKTRTYRFTYTDINGCTASDAITIYLDRTRNVFIPNVFSPNGDGNNDIFYINAGKDVAVVKSFRIFDRWGSLLHEVTDFAPNDPAFGWDGKFHGKNVVGNVFAYAIEIEFLDGWQERMTGDVTLIR